MSYAEVGAGVPIVLVHGWAANGAFFRDLAAELAKSHRVYTLTLRGHAGSEKGAAPLTIETLADDIAHFFETLDLRSACALGWSMGAMALWAAAPRICGRLSSLIVEDMSPRLINDANWEHGIASGYGASDVANTVSEIEADWPAYVSRFAPRMFAASMRDACPELEAWAAGEMAKADAHAMAAFWQSMAAQDFRAALARIATPMLVIHGGDSQVYDDGATAFIADTAPNAKRVVIQGAGHVPHLEAPDDFLNQVEAFVRETRRPEVKSGGGAVP
ncbi:MAG: alpha/beta hydrolase [Hyphomonadaceae bacterium]|nr:alpha/beta hydrolase [Hyphomonadaceae bacterium]MCA8885148.1 alpha/beta hydrolase [Hyphomonadaceae bacterium]